MPIIDPARDLVEPEGGIITPDWYDDHDGALQPNDETQQLASELCETIQIPDDPCPQNDVDLLDYYKAVLQKHGRDYWRQNQQRGTCHPAGTRVQMADGSEKSIEDIKIGDEVMSHAGNTCRVSKTGCRQFTGEMETITLAGFPFPLTVTSDHEVLVYDRRRSGAYWTPAEWIVKGSRLMMPYRDREWGEVCAVDLADVCDLGQFARGPRDEPSMSDEWVRAKHSALKVNRHVELNDVLCWLVGMYVAEGCTELRRVNWTLHFEEELYAQLIDDAVFKAFGVECLHSEDEGTTKRTVRVNSRVLADFFRWACPGKSTTKSLNAVFFGLPRSCRIALLRGWIDGDGHVKNRDGRGVPTCITAVTSSHQLNRDMHRLAISCGMKPSTTFRRKAAHQTVAATVLEIYGEDVAEIIEDVSQQSGPSKNYARVAGGFAVKVKSVERDSFVVEQPVYSLEVEGDHSYVAEGIAVHNCVGQGVCVTARIVSAINHFMAGSDWIGSFAVAPVYAGGRVEIGGSPGGWDGSHVPWSCKWVKEYGLISHEEMGIPEGSLWDDEKPAVNWTKKSSGVPTEYEHLSKERPITSYYKLYNIHEIEWFLELGCPVVHGSNTIPSGNTDSNGVTVSVKQGGGHCVGTWAKRYVDGEVQFAYDNSWGDSWGVGGRVWLERWMMERILQRDDVYALRGQTGLDSVADDVLRL